MLRDFDYEKLKRSLGVIVERYVPPEILTPEAHPVRFLEHMEKKRMATARRGLIVAIADNIEATQDLQPAELREVDAELEKADAYTLSFLRSHFTRRKLKI